MNLKSIRQSKKITQAESAKYLGIPLRTYQFYEANDSKCPPMKYLFITQKLKQYGYLDETHGLLSIETITKTCREVFAEFPVSYCYLFGSYAKNKATEKSDVDLLISSEIKGLAFYELVEVLREKLCKKVDLLNISQLANNPELLNEILRDGIKIYGQH